ncbi:MAG: alpha/beta hydrolase [Calditrichaeota bacterium]|jgi:pimeloyl-ACP methyl ester carboxylesterase|nr:alpha/beta hydrolase [Deltaproteobacteria bacterium]MBT4641586.1 alpha/beta hydrolase [Deltaproteobacteria bacterium]MBT7618710.1 alpha/beta hydrolase [Calditrichota bacterium]
MPNIKANGIQIEYDTFGNKTDTPILLVIGIANQLLSWDDPLCEKLANAGYYVIRFDNRDVGLSTIMDDLGVPDVMETIGKIFEGKSVSVPYTYDDMADDAAGLLDALGIEKAHLIGMSMGAGIVQTVAIRHPKRLLSLIPIYGSTGNPKLPPPTPEAWQALTTTPVSEEKEAIVDQFMNTFRVFSGSGFPFDEAWHKDLAERSYDRGVSPDGLSRQLLAGMAHGNRKPALSKVNVPTLVIHGSEDPIMNVAGGKDIADAVPNAELMIIDGMGHDMPKLGGAWDQITDRIIEFTAKVDAK